MTTMNSLPPDPYKALGVDKDADLGAIKTAYRKLVLKCHPDKVQDPDLKAAKQDEFQRVQQAYEILGDGAKRKEYDDDVRFRKLRDQFHKNMPQSSPRSTPKNHYEYNVNIRPAERPPSFRSTPPAGSAPRSPYPSNPQFSSSWEREIPSHSKPIYDEERKARRAPSYDKPLRKEEDSKDERRRRKEADEQASKDRDREKRRLDRDRERERERERERDRDRRAAEKAAEREQRDREERKAEEKRVRKERERKEKEADQQRRRQQDEKHSSKKAAYVEPFGESSDEHRPSKKKAVAPDSAKKPGHDSPRRDKSARREASPVDESKEKMGDKLWAAAHYMHHARRRGSKSGSGGYHPESPPAPYSAQFPNPDEIFHGSPDTPRSRRPSYDERGFHAKVEDEVDHEAGNPGPAEAKPPHPRLQKSFTSPPGTTMHNMANSSAPRVPHLSRAQTMQPEYRPPPAAPAAPPLETSRHSIKLERRRRGSLESYDDERPRRSMGHPNVVRYKLDEADMPRAADSPRYRDSEDVYSSPSGGGRSGAGFQKVKVAPSYSHEQVYQGKRYNYDDVEYAKVGHVYHSHSHSGYPYGGGYVPAA